MASRTERLNKIAPPRVRAQAALWVTELQGPDRDAALEAAVRRWIEADPPHAAAFELASQTWQRSGNLPGELPPHAAHRRRPLRPGRGTLRAVAACAIAALLIGVYFARDGTFSTGAAEQRTVELSDGTQVALNANSRLQVQYDDRVRKVTLLRGEASFDVKKHQPRPFVVVVGSRKVVALGTSFVVRRDEAGESPATPTSLSVTLVEGRVAIEPLSWPDTMPGSRAPDATVLIPGERLRVQGEGREVVDSPSLASVTAWRHGRLIFDDVSLAAAAAEFNRYGKLKLRIGASSANHRVGGVFKIGDAMSFAQTMANTYHLRLETHGSIISLDEASEQ